MRAGPDRPSAARGFTLIELVVTIALIAILMAVAAPNFVSFQRNSQLTSSANAFIGSLAAARAEAMRRNHDAYVVPDLRIACAAGDWSCGWYVFVDMNRNQVYDGPGSTDVLISQEGKLPAAITTPATANVSQFRDGSSIYVMYNGAGFPRLKDGSIRTSQSLDFAIGSSTAPASMRRVVSSATGRVWVCKPGDTGCTQ